MLAILALLGAGCSLLGLDDFEIATCETQAECEAVNTEREIGAGACERYWCRGGECRLGRGELCDGIDNDCNGVIDDIDAARDALADDQPLTVAGATRLRVSSTSAESGVFLTWVDDTGAVSIAPGAATAEPFAFAMPASTSSCAPLDPGSAGSCPDGMGNPTGSCAVDDVALGGDLGLGDRTSVAAVVTGDGCAGGQLYIAAQIGNDLGVLGNQTRSTTWRGAGACVAASSPAVSALDPTTDPRTLVAWSRRRLDETAECGTATAAPVALIGAWYEARGGDQWTTATGTGMPELLSDSAAIGPPAVAAWPGAAGWIVAHAPASGGIELVPVSPYVTGPVASCVEMGPARASEPLALGAPVPIPSETEVARRVVIAAGDAPDTGGAALVVWQRECGESSSIWAAAVRRPGGEAVVSEPVRLSDDRAATRPALTWTFGGALVAWIAAPEGRPGAVRGRRVSIAEGRVVPAEGELGLSRDDVNLEAAVWVSPSEEVWHARTSLDRVALARVACLAR